jgi:hypothetical protein
MDYYDRVTTRLKEIGCYRVALLRPGVESWISPRTGRFTVDNPIRSRQNANNILINAGDATIL